MRYIYFRRGFHFFFFNDTATTEIYTLSLHDALPISRGQIAHRLHHARTQDILHLQLVEVGKGLGRSEEHTSELQSRLHLVCRLLLEKKKKINMADSTQINRRA